MTVRNYLYLVLGLGLDGALVVVTLATLLVAPSVSALGALVIVAVLAPFLALGLRAALIRVVLDPHGVRVVNLWRSYRLSWAEVDGFAASPAQLERFARRGRVRVFLGLACDRRRDGREITLSAVSASGSLIEPRRFVTEKLPAIVARLNQAGEVAAGQSGRTAMR